MNCDRGFCIASASDGACLLRIRGELAIGASFDAANLYSVRSTRVLTMMQSYASAAKLRAVGPFSPSASQPRQTAGPHHLGSSVSSPAKAKPRVPKVKKMFLSAGGLSACRAQDDTLQ